MEREERTAGRRVLVCGGGDYQDWLAVAGTLRRVHDSSPIGLIIILLAVTQAPLHSPSGGLAWQGFRRAGSTPTFDRMGRLPNDLIVESTPDLVVAFPGKEPPI